MITYSIEEYAAQLCGADDTGAPLPGKVAWLTRQLRAGKLPGYKAGRRWRATEADVAEAIEKLRPKVLVPEVPGLAGLTRTSARRLAS